MNLDFATEAIEFHVVVCDALRAKGGIDLLRSAEADPSTRATIATALDELGVWDLTPRSDPIELEAAALTCRAAGGVGLPYPVAERLAATEPMTALAVIGTGAARVNHASVDLRWLVADGMGRVADVVTVSDSLRTKLGTFVCPVTIGAWRFGDSGNLSLTLQAWTLLGMLESAAAMAYDYVQSRVQFGKPLASFQSVQFRLTDVAVGVHTLEELAKYTLWSVARDDAESATDVMALRLAALETASAVFAAVHQVHGAIGFCDETDVSWLSRHSQPLRRLPWSHAQTEAVLLDRVNEHPLDGLFDAAQLAAPLR